MSRAIRKPFAAGIDKAAAQLFLGRIGHGVDQKVDGPEMFRGFGKDRVNGVVVGDIALFHKGAADAVGQRFDPLFQNFPGIAETQFSPFFVQRLGNPPGNRNFCWQHRRSDPFCRQTDPYDCSLCNKLKNELRPWAIVSRIEPQLKPVISICFFRP